MNSREDIVKNFIQKVSDIQNTKDNEGLSSAELKQIALEMGMSEDDWKKVQKTYTDYLALLPHMKADFWNPDPGLTERWRKSMQHGVFIFPRTTMRL